ncbi:alpha/beta fold hydrolase [Rhodopirellula sp. JC740]|uniref:Alpha/beta fold hydrolase n=1 Tax=Rhodopirellula halodulae TaxID=2894198 RepID=A0ABS8NJA4_9BACT|nr:alpha/beta fold hydrolase [Rhodopirellula sp. JC740]MCC9643611.1 alpha/beta fold hydrolase [Rhodopirellula sp. JC740]
MRRGILLAAAFFSGWMVSAGPSCLIAQAEQSNETTQAQSEVAVNVSAGEQTENFFAIPNPAEGRPEKLPYLLYTPKDYVAGQEVPVLLFLHGLGESGDGDFGKLSIHGPPKRIAKEGQSFPFVVVAPQSPKPGNSREEIVESWRASELMSLLDHIEQHLTIDQSRVYLSGLSMGGFGSWRLAAKHPERFAAVVPVCGGGKVEWAESLATVPIWAFHGLKDNVVKVEESEEMVRAIQRAGGDVKLTIYPDAGHDSWTETFANPEVYAWLLRHQRPAQ